MIRAPSGTPTYIVVIDSRGKITYKDKQIIFFVSFSNKRKNLIALHYSHQSIQIHHDR